MKPAHLPFEVRFANGDAWVGLGHVFATQEYTQGRWRAAIPFLVPTVVQSFPEGGASAAVDNQDPVFYVQASDLGALYPTFDPDQISLLRLRTRQGRREVPVSKGITTFTFAPRVPGQFLIPISLKQLSATLMELTPRKPLSPGQYLITIGAQQKDGFEFEIKCK